VLINLKYYDKKYCHALHLIRQKYREVEGHEAPIVAPDEPINITDGISPTATVQQLMNFRRMINVSTRHDENSIALKNKFREQLRNRGIHIDMNDEAPLDDAPLSIDKVTVKPHECLISKTKLLSMIDRMIELYTLMKDNKKWKEHGEDIRKSIHDSFSTYCAIAKKFKSVKEIKTALDKFSMEYMNVLKSIQNSSEVLGVEGDTIKNSLEIKVNEGQLFMMDMLKLLNITQIKDQMDDAAKIFKYQYQFINNVIEPLAKPNCCKICLTDQINTFIDTCGHTMCRSCADKLIKPSEMVENLFEMRVDGGSKGNCPYCCVEFKSTNLKKIFL
jgi:hypothetical protein